MMRETGGGFVQRYTGALSRLFHQSLRSCHVLRFTSLSCFCQHVLTIGLFHITVRSLTTTSEENA